MNIIYNKCSKYQIEGIDIELVCEDRMAHYIIDSNIYCLGDEPDDIQTAIMAYEQFFDVRLSDSKVNELYCNYLDQIEQ